MKVFSNNIQPKKSSNFLPKKPILPNPDLSLKLFFIGATLGPIVDSIHNQSLLIYDRAPIYIPSPVEAASVFTSSPSIYTTDKYLFCSSWYIPPLLGFAYVILGAVLPRLVQRVVVTMNGGQGDSGSQENSRRIRSLSSSEEKSAITPTSSPQKFKLRSFVTQSSDSNDVNARTPSTNDEKRRNESQILLKEKAILAVASTALIIKLSDFLQANPSFSSAIQQAIIQSSGVEIPTNTINLGIMIAAAVTQWVTLDRTFYALLTAVLVGVGGPLSELPFVQYGFWHYNPEAADYFPVEELIALLQTFLSSGTDQGTDVDFFLNDYSNLALSSITGPCYCAVTLDAIALGRWLETHSSDDLEMTPPPSN